MGSVYRWPKQKLHLNLLGGIEILYRQWGKKQWQASEALYDSKENFAIVFLNHIPGRGTQVLWKTASNSYLYSKAGNLLSENYQSVLNISI